MRTECSLKPLKDNLRQLAFVPTVYSPRCHSRDSICDCPGPNSNTSRCNLRL